MLKNFLAILYAVILFYLTLFSNERYSNVTGSRTVNLTLFNPDKYYMQDLGNLHPHQIKFIALEFFGNVLLFVPFAFVLYLINKRKLSNIKVYLLVLLTTLFIEFSQFTFNVGYFDIDDIVLNFLGGVIGNLFLNIIIRKRKNENSNLWH